jgi:hypothetical protein
MNVIATATDFTLDQLLALEDIDNHWVVIDPKTLQGIVREKIELLKKGPDDVASCGNAER